MSSCQPSAISYQRRVHVVLWFTVVAAPLWGQAPTTGAFVTRLGNDTIAVERYTFDGRELKGTSVALTPRVTMRSYSATLGADGRLARFQIAFGAVGAPPVQTSIYTYTADSVFFEQRRDTTTRTRRTAATGRPLPFFADLFGTWELALRRAWIAGGEDAPFGVLVGQGVLNYGLQGKVPGDVDLLTPERDYGPLHARVAADGELLSFDLRGTTDKYLAERVASLDVSALAARFAERERRGQGLGTLSPRDTARAAVGGAHVMVDYGRPSVRGRTIFGNVVPWNEVWRAGANEATQLVTDRDLVIGTTTVPAGTYSLFTIPSERGWRLIINRQHGQWGTNYDAAQDLARLDMTTRTLPDPVERLTIGLRPDGNGGVLSVAWEGTEAFIRFTAK